ncbi:hypothetical protein A3K48_01235 [candidate division WOR-1 bacterium RIFOXYA12_FULL_52_29]|uniref:4-alpha-glucanotransferase n=1 Tax=candidate division WOR-1 bacterium RIFOXYC12_FULL_54_18 TaxID=1802584 RepID=A0A1F4T4B1_UNCSA|nr:MAG: hypothetical protein A3K44_01235 [candidate division WOR-1 bacterium RIFOXYA2_FULL_51_19]OGC17214.1 MAG: hypothetical protein A3K48_01235 [candidate division WOR-1 bacterium RIFOXYA12_FULL_52_29]OGC26074.1 MAG: hypothetical protein A3K32_01230 [candidate division WOR-1 bacterium RIFOXYB2_FULL_45_9]OGC27631.1 MAG: hypothetical protein A3K49_01235 [candidate division WOR-1 bacterium RIFOXYC12_FULL_54_18]OGC29155.1 MAG: hypothetical protein A2346_00470 [candidate division WOR-1 bacterium R
MNKNSGQSKTRPVDLLLAVHCHQPVGNLDQVIEEAYQRSYLPFIETLREHPRIKFAAHYSGVLLEWFEARHPEFLGLLKDLVRKGQLELLTGGHYEPILSLIPDDDKLGQIKMLNDYLKGKFGSAPRGMWLAERVWEPHLPRVLAQSGVEYTLLDDSHFIAAGLEKEKLGGYYLTEESGEMLRIFPISRYLRHAIPFKKPDEVIDHLRQLSAGGQGLAVIADDGEKFGLWPGTQKVFSGGYLNKLFDLIEKTEWLRSRSFSDYLEEELPAGRIYLPANSYFEMMDWSLPAPAEKKFKRIIEDLKKSDYLEEFLPFLSGGFFRNFLVKYPESNLMHKRMLQVSDRLSRMKKGKSLLGEKEFESRLKEAELALYKSQCGCAYWHGIFSGIYLNYLRHAVYENILKAEAVMDSHARGSDDYADITITDLDRDGREEVLLTSSMLNLYFSPAQGGTLFEIDYKPKNFNLVNNLARREEAYHEKIKPPAWEGGAELSDAARKRVDRAKKAGLDELLIYDRRPRFCLVDHFLGEGTTLESFSRNKYKEEGDFSGSYTFMPQRRGNEVLLRMKNDGEVGGRGVRVEKEISIMAKQSIINIVYDLSNLSDEVVHLWFGTEFNFSFLTGNNSDIPCHIEGEENGQNISGVTIVDERKGFSVVLALDRPAALWRFPIETVSISESGFEKTFQSSLFFPNWKISLHPGQKWKIKIALRIEE